MLLNYSYGMKKKKRKEKKKAKSLDTKKTPSVRAFSYFLVAPPLS